MTRLHSYKIRDIFINFFGPLPWTCGECLGIITVYGKAATDGMIHHISEDPTDNSRDNLLAMHNRCHSIHHSYGKHNSPDARTKISEALTGQPLSNERKVAISNALRGRRFTTEHRQKISDALVQHLSQPEAREQRRRAATGYKHTEASRAKMSAAKKGIVPQSSVLRGQCSCGKISTRAAIASHAKRLGHEWSPL